MTLRMIVLLLLAATGTGVVRAQSGECAFKPPFYLLHFGRGNVADANATALALYTRISSYCPSDGYYSYASATRDCFKGDWHTLLEDHTPGDVAGNMLLVNSADEQGTFLTVRIKGFKGGKTYRFGAWLMNLCKPTEKCPFPLLPNLTVQLQTLSGKGVARFATGDLPRVNVPGWTQHRADFGVPPGETELVLTLVNNAPGGCGNDLVLDDITFSECIKPEPVAAGVKKAAPPVVKAPPPVAKKDPKTVPVPAGQKRDKPVAIVEKARTPLPAPQPVAPVAVPLVLKQRTSFLTRQIETEAGEILLDLYDNGEIDGDTVSIYHNNTLVVANQLLSQKPLSFRIRVTKNEPHHELVMVANNLGSIPPNTSLMIVTTKEKRHQVFISSTKQTNAKVVIDLKE